MWRCFNRPGWLLWGWTGCVSLLLLAGSPDPPGNTAARVLARVNGKPITERDVEKVLREYGRSDSPRERLLSLTPEGHARALHECIIRKLFLLGARADGIQLDADARSRLRAMEEDLLIHAYLRQQEANKPIDEAAIRAYYEQHRTEFRSPETRRVRQLVVKTRAQAEALLAALRNGADFTTLAATHNIDASRARGGYLGNIRRGMMVKPFEDLAFALEPGEFAGPVKTRFGFHLVLVEAITPARQLDLETARPKIVRALTKERRKQIEEKLKQRFPVEMPAGPHREAATQK